MNWVRILSLLQQSGGTRFTYARRGTSGPLEEGDWLHLLCCSVIRPAGIGKCGEGRIREESGRLPIVSAWWAEHCPSGVIRSGPIKTPSRLARLRSMSLPIFATIRTESVSTMKYGGGATCQEDCEQLGDRERRRGAGSVYHRVCTDRVGIERVCAARGGTESGVRVGICCVG